MPQTPPQRSESVATDAEWTLDVSPDVLADTAARVVAAWRARGRQHRRLDARFVAALNDLEHLLAPPDPEETP